MTMHVQELNGVACINGEFLPAQDATASIFDSGFIGGVSVFDRASPSALPRRSHQH